MARSSGKNPGANPNTNNLHTLLSEDGALQPLLAKLRRVNALQQIYVEALADALPGPGGLAQGSRVSAIVGTTVFISAANGPVAAKLKQVAPRLLQRFQMQEQELTSVRVEVQPVWPEAATPGSRPPASPHLAMDDAQLAALAGQLSESPLKAALEQIKRRRVRRAR